MSFLTDKDVEHMLKMRYTACKECPDIHECLGPADCKKAQNTKPFLNPNFKEEQRSWQIKKGW